MDGVVALVYVGREVEKMCVIVTLLHPAGLRFSFPNEFLRFE